MASGQDASSALLRVRGTVVLTVWSDARLFHRRLRREAGTSDLMEYWRLPCQSTPTGYGCAVSARSEREAEAVIGLGRR